MKQILDDLRTKEKELRRLRAAETNLQQRALLTRRVNAVISIRDRLQFNANALAALDLTDGQKQQAADFLRTAVDEARAVLS